MNEGVVAALFYMSVAFLVVGLIRALRASVERNVRDVPAMVLAGVGVVGLAIGVVAYLHGPRTMIPF